MGSGGDDQWTGWWGDDPPFHHPVFVLTHQQYLRVGLIDELHLAIVPILLGGGERLFDHLDGGPEGYECAEFVNPGSVAHVRFVRVR